MKEIEKLRYVKSWLKSCKTVPQIENIERFLDNLYKELNKVKVEDIIILNHELGYIRGMIEILKR